MADKYNIEIPGHAILCRAAVAPDTTVVLVDRPGEPYMVGLYNHVSKEFTSRGTIAEYVPALRVFALDVTTFAKPRA